MNKYQNPSNYRNRKEESHPVRDAFLYELTRFAIREVIYNHKKMFFNLGKFCGQVRNLFND